MGNGHFGHFQACRKWPNMTTGSEFNASNHQWGPKGWVRWIITRPIIFKSFSDIIFKIGSCSHVPNSDWNKNCLQNWGYGSINLKITTKKTSGGTSEFGARNCCQLVSTIDILETPQRRLSSSLYLSSFWSLRQFFIVSRCQLPAIALSKLSRTPSRPACAEQTCAGAELSSSKLLFVNASQKCKNGN